VNKTAKQRLSQSEIDSLVQQASVKKQLGSGPGLPAPRPQKHEAKPNVESRRLPEEAAAPAEAAVTKPENQRQPVAKAQEQPRAQQAKAAAKNEEPQSAAKAVESSSAQRSPLELKQYFWLGGEGTSDLQPDRVMTVLNKKLSRLG
jgi:hypothetical protein